MERQKSGLPPLDSVVTEIRKEKKRQKRKEEKWRRNQERERITEQTKREAYEKAMTAIRQDCYWDSDDERHGKRKYRDELDRIMRIDEAELLAASKSQFVDDEDPVNYDFYLGDKRVKKDLIVKQMIEQYQYENEQKAANPISKSPSKRIQQELMKKEFQNYLQDFDTGDNAAHPVIQDILMDMARRSENIINENGEFEIKKAQVIHERDAGGELRMERNRRYHPVQPHLDLGIDPYGHSPTAGKILREASTCASSIRNSVVNPAIINVRRSLTPSLKPKREIHEHVPSWKNRSASSIDFRAEMISSPSHRNRSKAPGFVLTVPITSKDSEPPSPTKQVNFSPSHSIYHIQTDVGFLDPTRRSSITELSPTTKEDLWLQKQKQETLKRMYIDNAKTDTERIIEKNGVNQRLYTKNKKIEPEKSDLQLMPTYEYWEEYKIKFKDDYKARSLKQSYVSRIRAKKRYEHAIDPKNMMSEQELNDIESQIARDKKRKKELDTLPKITIVCKPTGFDSVITEVQNESSDEEVTTTEKETNVSIDEMRRKSIQRLEESLEQQRALVSPIMAASHHEEKIAQMKVLKKYGSWRKARIASKLNVLNEL